MTSARDGAVVATLEPARRHFATRRMATTQAGIATLNFGQLYVGDRRPQRRRRAARRGSTGSRW